MVLSPHHGSKLITAAAIAIVMCEQLKALVDYKRGQLIMPVTG